MSIINDETSEVIYLNVQALNNSQTNSLPQLCIINQQSNMILRNLQDWNIYLQGITLTSTELPYLNIYRNIAWDNNNFTINKTNLSVSFLSNNGSYPFTIPVNETNLLVSGFGQNPNNATEYQGITVFLQYQSENANPTSYPNPTNDGTGANSQNYPRGYFNIHSIQQFLDMINTAITTANSFMTDNLADSMHFAYDPTTQLYSLSLPYEFKTNGTVDFYANAFLKRYLEGFRWQLYNYSTTTDANYNGCDYKLILPSYTQPDDPQYADNELITAEYSTLANLVDIHSILVVPSGGDLQNVVPQIIPTQTSSTTVNGDLPTIACLKNLDIDFSSLQLSQINNSFFQYETTGLFFPINTTGTGQLRTINLQLMVMNMDNTLYPLSIPAGSGYCNIRLACKKRTREDKNYKK